MRHPSMLFAAAVFCALVGLFLFIAHLAETVSYRRSLFEIALVIPLLLFFILPRALARV